MNPHYPHFLNLYPGFKDVDYFCPKYTQFTNANSFFPHYPHYPQSSQTLDFTGFFGIFAIPFS